MSNEKRKVRVVSEELFDHNNPNRDIFTVESEAGGDSEDTMCSMIGDATMAHLQSLSPAERQCWEHYVLMGNENLFSFAPSVADTDRDPHGLKVEDLEGYFMNNEVTEKFRPVIEEAIAEEKERREKSEDVYDRAELLIPYQDWADNPGLSKHFDIPSTPKDTAVFCGNTTQQFYDHFPEGHPDSKTINDLLVRLNRDSSDLTDKYGDWLKTWLGQQPIKLPYTLFVLDLLVTRLTEGVDANGKMVDPTEVIQKALTCLDDDYRQMYLREVNQKTEKDAVRKLLLRKQIEWDEDHAKGMNVLPFVKTFGQLLYTKFRGSIRRSHWALYKSLKARYMLPVLVKGVDINTCRLSDLERVLKVSRRVAIEIYTNRPFASPQELLKREVMEKAVTFKDDTGKEVVLQPAKKVTRGWISEETMNEVRGSIEQLYEMIRETAEKASGQGNLKSFSGISETLVNRQKVGHDNWSSKEWGALWAFYRSTKSDILSKVREGRDD